jgi:hypothetical protein
MIRNLGGKHFERRMDTDLVSMHSTVDVDEGTVTVKAKFESQSTNQSTYFVKIIANTNNGSIKKYQCSCPVGGCCKHCCRTLIESIKRRIPENPEFMRRDAKRRRTERLLDDGVSVYIAITSKSETDSGSDYRRSRDIKENFDQEILGIFFSRKKANDCAKQHVIDELDYDYDDGKEDEEDDGENDDDENGDDDDEVSDDDGELFTWDNEEACEEYWFSKVWVEERPIQDASPFFHK